MFLEKNSSLPEKAGESGSCRKQESKAPSYFTLANILNSFTQKEKKLSVLLLKKNMIRQRVSFSSSKIATRLDLLM